MAKEKGTPKTGGRIKGIPNKTTTTIRESFQKLIEDNLEQLKADLMELPPAARVKAITELSKFCVPTLKAVDFIDNTPKEKEQKHIVFIKKK